MSVLVLALCLMSSAQAANITLVTETHDDDSDGFPDDQQNLAHQFEVYDALYAWCRLDVAKNES